MFAFARRLVMLTLTVELGLASDAKLDNDGSDFSLPVRDPTWNMYTQWLADIPMVSCDLFDMAMTE